MVAWVMPKKYGDKVTQELSVGEDGGAITMIQLIAVDPKPRQQPQIVTMTTKPRKP